MKAMTAAYLALAVLIFGSTVSVARESDESRQEDEIRQEDNGAEDVSDRFELGVIEVTGSGAGELAPVYPAVESISRQELRRHERYDATEAVNLLPGVMVENIGNRNERVVFLRGFDSRQVPLYVDGIPVYVPWDGSIDLGRFTTFDIAEIRVTKSFTSVLYGPNTLGGSINLISMRPRHRFEADILAGAGFDNDSGQNVYRLGANAGGNYGTWYYQLGASVRDSDGFSPSDDYDPAAGEDGGERDNAYYRDTKISLKLGYTPNATDEYTVSYYKQDGEKGTPPYGGTEPSFRVRNWRWPFYDKESVYFLSRTSFGDGHYVRLRAYYDQFDNLLSSFDDDTYTTQFRPFAFNSTYDDHTYGGGAEFGFAVAPAHTLKVAASAKFDIHEEQDDVGEPWEEYEDRTYSVGIEDTWRYSDATTVIGGISWNRQESVQADQVLPDFTIVPFPTGEDTAINAQLGWFHELSESLAVRASVGRKTRFPTISNRFSARFGSALPNPDLKAESSINYELGLDATAGRIRYGGALFLSKLDDAIVSVTIDDSLCSSPPCSQNQNVEEQENKGVELYIDIGLNAMLDLHFNYTYLDRENETNPEIQPIDTPNHKAFAYLVYSPMQALELIGSVVYEDSRLNETDGSRSVPSFTVANLKASWQLVNGVLAEFGVNNVLDENYAYDEGYPEAGRNYFVTLRYRY